LTGGTGSFTATLKTAGTQSITATDGTSTGSHTGITVSPAPTSLFVVTGFPSPVTAGKAGSFTVTAQDAYGNTTPAYAGTVTFTSSDGQASLPGSATLTGGTGSFTATLKTAGTQSITVIDSNSGSITGTQAGITVSPAAASKLVISSQPTTATAGSPFGATVVYEEDQFGNVETTDSSTMVTAALASGTGPLQGTTQVAVSNGVATFTTLFDNKAETIALNFTGGSLSAAMSRSIVVNPAVATKLVMGTQPSAAATAGLGFTTQPVVYEEDQFGNVETTDSSTTVTAGLASGAGPLQGTTQVAVSGGVATFTNLADNTAETITLKFTSGSLTPATSSSIAVSAAAASKLVVTAQPSATETAGLALATQPVVKEEDQFGNVITSDSTNTVTAARGSHGTGALQGSSLTVTLVNGVASFSGLYYTNAETMNIAFTTTAGSFTATSNDVAVSPAATSKFNISAPASVKPGVAFTVTVTAQDTYGNTTPAYRGTVHFTCTDPRAVLPSDYTFTSVDNGAHSFTSDVMLKKLGTQTITVWDKANKSITGSVNVNVSNTSQVAMAGSGLTGAGAAAGVGALPASGWGVGMAIVGTAGGTAAPAGGSSGTATAPIGSAPGVVVPGEGCDTGTGEAAAADIGLAALDAVLAAWDPLDGSGAEDDLA
jgi:hypothetical protein